MNPEVLGRQERDEDEKKVASLGRRFVLLKGLWLKDDLLDTRIDEDYDEKKRFDGAQVQGQLRNLLYILPCRYKGKVMRERDGLSAWGVELMLPVYY